MFVSKKALALTAAATLGFGSAQAAHVGSVYSANLTPLNSSGVGGVATVTFTDSSLILDLSATGLETGQPHVMHVHGAFDDMGNPVDSVSPLPSADTDGDNLVEIPEGAPFYGPILLPFTQDDGTPYTTDTGTLAFTQEIAESDTDAFADGFTYDDLLPLDLREFVIHGLTVPEGVGAGSNFEVQGQGGYVAGLPVASGEFVLVSSPGDGTPPNVIPTPSAVAGGLALLGLVAGRRRRSQDAA